MLTVTSVEKLYKSSEIIDGSSSVASSSAVASGVVVVVETSEVTLVVFASSAAKQAPVHSIKIIAITSPSLNIFVFISSSFDFL